MSPFSATFYFLRNKSRTIVITLMISLICICYVGGLYLMNIKEEAVNNYSVWKDYVQLQGSYEDIDGQEFEQMQKQILEDPLLHCYRVGYNYAQNPTMLGFTNGFEILTFTMEDFKRLNQREHLISTDASLKEGMLLLSEREATYLKVKEGDSLENDFDRISAYLGNTSMLEVGPVIKKNAFMGCMITEETMKSSGYMVTWADSAKQKEFDDVIRQIKQTYPTVKVTTHADRMKNVNEVFEVNDIIYYSITAITAIVFAITTNAVFVGAYERRKKEFVLYEAIGIRKRRIYMKIVKEILLMDGIGLVLGAIVGGMAVFLLNRLVFASQGLVMRYYNPTAFWVTFLCNMAILVPGILFRFKFIHKVKQWVD